MACLAAVMLTACTQGPKDNAAADRLIEAAHKARHYQRLALLADSLHRRGDITAPKAYYWQGYAYERLTQRRVAEFFWDKAIEAGAESTSPDDLDYYARAACRLANLLSTHGDIEGTLRAAVPVAERLEALQCDTTSDYVNMLIYIGCCQSRNNVPEDSINDSFSRAYQKHIDDVDSKHTDEAYKNAIAGVVNIAYNYNEIHDYPSALKWTERYGKLITQYEQRSGISPDYVDKQWARYDIYRAIALQGSGKADEAKLAYADFLKTAYSQTPEGRIMAVDYLMAAKRWSEAADNYKSLDLMLSDNNTRYTLENIQNMVLRKYRANYLAGRHDSALAVSMLVSETLDSAIVKTYRQDNYEQKVIRAKVLEMAAEEASAARQRMYVLIGALIALLAAFIVFALHRRRAAHAMKQAYSDLQGQYDHIASEAAAKALADHDRQLSHDLLRGASTAALPAVEGISLAATESPSACDFCYCLPSPGGLCLCIGGTAQASARAATAAAIAREQSRALMANGATPEQTVSAVASTMSTGGYEPVSLFVALLDPATGRLSYCNHQHPEPLTAADNITPLPADGHEATLAPGTTLLLYAAELADAEDSSQRRFGEKRLAGEALQAKKTGSAPEAFIARLTEAAQRFTGTGIQPTMLAIQYK